MSTYSNPLTEYSPQMELEYAPPAFEGQSTVFNEDREMEFAARLLEVANEQELDYFFGDLIKGAANAIGSVVKSPIGQAIGGVLKKVAGTALPLAGTALGGMVGGPLGAQIGGGLASMAGHALGLELEGLSAEDREFESARQFVRFAGETVRNALEASPGANPAAVAHSAALDAARTYAPGLIASEPTCGSGTDHARVAAGGTAGLFGSERNSRSQDRRKRMHDIDRTQFEYGQEMETEYYPQAGETEALGEDEVMEYAAELMELETEEEFENFLGDLVSGVVDAAKGFVGGPAGQALGGLLKGAAKKLLPMAGQALGGWVGGPIGAQLGGQLAGRVAGAMEMEADEMEWEAAKTFVRFAAEAAKNLAQAPPGEHPEASATQAVTDAAQTHAPVLLAQGDAKSPVGPPSPKPPSGPPSLKAAATAPTAWTARQPPATGCRCGGHHHHHHAGHWIRRGDQIILFGI
jgi:hypothetical protein